MCDVYTMPVSFYHALTYCSFSSIVRATTGQMRTPGAISLAYLTKSYFPQDFPLIFSRTVKRPRSSEQRLDWSAQIQQRPEMATVKESLRVPFATTRCIAPIGRPTLLVSGRAATLSYLTWTSEAVKTKQHLSTFLARLVPGARKTRRSVCSYLYLLSPCSR